MRDDNFGDHKLTGTGRVDATARAPLDYGMGSKKMKYIKCPKCEKILECRKSTVKIQCGNCHYTFDVNDAVQPTIDEIWESIKDNRLSPEYLALRKNSEIKAQQYIDKKKKTF